MRIVIALLLFGLSAFSMIGEGRIHISLLTVLLALGGLAVLLAHFRPPQK